MMSTTIIAVHAEEITINTNLYGYATIVQIS